jgi:hypothetical protein
MKTTFKYSTAFAVAMALAGAAFAQSYSTTTTTSPATPVVIPGYPGSENYGSGFRASTAEQGMMEGAGNMVRSFGEAGYYNSLAMINGQEAYSRYLQNVERRTETYFRLQQINRAARDAERGERLTYEQYVELAKKYAPDGLTQQQYDRTLGRLNWPKILMGEEFAPEREALNRAFLVRTPLDAGATSGFYGNVHRIAESMNAKLRARFDQLTPPEYIAALKFISGVTMESYQPLVVSALAAR